MDVTELAAILAELERHPRLTACSLGEMSFTFAAAQEPPGAPAETDGETAALELPEGVLDPRARIDAIYARARKAAAPATDEPS